MGGGAAFWGSFRCGPFMMVDRGRDGLGKFFPGQNFTILNVFKG